MLYKRGLFNHSTFLLGNNYQVLRHIIDVIPQKVEFLPLDMFQSVRYFYKYIIKAREETLIGAHKPFYGNSKWYWTKWVCYREWVGQHGIPKPETLDLHREIIQRVEQADKGESWSRSRF